ncbi:MAG: glycosyltransferase [Candidatus Eremiobacteraeota bacterium]|nr:glycosyltransferase [Candidatus Eremiobacteraeota bacterium]
MHVLIYCVGSAGDVYPFIAIGESLQRRGHEVQVLTAGLFRDKIERAGLGFIEAGSQEQYDEVIQNPDLWHPKKGAGVILRLFGDGWPLAYAFLVDHVRPHDTVLVTSTLGMSARLLQEKLGTKLVTVHLQPSSLLSATDPGALAALPWAKYLPVWAARALIASIDRGMSFLLCPKLNAFRATIALPPVRSIRRWMNSPERVVCAFPPWFAAPQRDWPANAVSTTFPRLVAAEDERLSGELLAFFNAGAPPIAYTPGSAHAHGRAFFERALAATEKLGMRAVFVTRYRDQLPDALPSWVHYEPYAPYDLLAPRVAAFVHHGGIGTSATVLAAGTPQLITPFTFDQPDNAARLKKLGVAESVSPKAPATQWARALSRLLNDPAVANTCREIAARMAVEEPGGEQIANWIEKL